VRTFDLLQPTNIDEAVSLLAQHGDEARLIGGGAMLMILLRERLIDPRYLIDVLSIGGLDYISTDGDGISVGASTTLAALERSPALQEAYPVVVEAIRVVGNVRVRNVATIGGHLAQADIHLDLPPVLVALDAAVIAHGPQGERLIPVHDLVTGYYETALTPDEMIISLKLPQTPTGLRGAYLKYCSLTPNDWPTVGVAAFLDRDDARVREARIVVGSVTDRPLRLQEAEGLLLGERLNRRAVAEVARRYAAAAEPMSDVRGSVEYKREVTEVYVRRAVEAAATRAGLTFADDAVG
jgi:carbon-monoxide dehydrogenase medium subunit